MSRVDDSSESTTRPAVSDDSFDPYHKWLGIPPDEQPPDHYQLLGLRRYEEDADVIESAADRQMAHLKRHAGGRRAAFSQKLLNELAAAKACLLEPGKREQYDAQLRGELNQTENASGDKPLSWTDGQPPKNLDEFLACLVASRLYDRGELDDFIANLPPHRRSDNHKALALEMVQEKKLTKYQANCIYQGRPYHLRFGNYEVFDWIGRGGMGQVYKARHRTMGRLAAVKVLSSKTHRSARALERFRGEVRMAAELSEHPNIVTAHDAGEGHGELYLVMEYVEGRDLATVLKQQGPLPVDKAVDAIRQAARGLEYAHSKGIVHQDVKPGNLMRLRDDTVKILDLGLASANEQHLRFGKDENVSSMPLPGQLVGTIDYISPEQASNRESAAPTRDVYSLGCTMYRLLTGEIPYPAGSKLQKLTAHFNAPIPSLCDKRDGISPALDEVFRRMVAKDPADRFQTMGDVVAALDAVQRGVLLPPPVQRSESGTASPFVDGALSETSANAVPFSFGSSTAADGERLASEAGGTSHPSFPATPTANGPAISDHSPSDSFPGQQTDSVHPAGVPAPPSFGNSSVLSELSAIGSAVHRSGIRTSPPARAEGEPEESSRAASQAWILIAAGGVLGLVLLATTIFVTLLLRGPRDEGQVAKDGESISAGQGGQDVQQPPDDAAAAATRPALAIEPIDDATVAPGALVEIRIVVPDRPDGCEFILFDAPAGAKITKQPEPHFVWRTTAENLGEHRVVILASCSRYKDSQRVFRIRVVRPSGRNDLIALLDLETAAVQGDWRIEDGALISPKAEERACLQLPGTPPPSYDLELEVERIEGEEGLQLGLLSGDTRWSVYLDGSSGSGLTKVDGYDYEANVTSYREPLFRPQRPSRLRCRVRPSQVQVSCDGRTIINFQGDLGRLSAPPEWTIPNARQLSLGSRQTGYRLSKVILSPVPAESSDPAHQLDDEIPGLVEYEGHYYRVYYERVPWADARERCQQLGGQLACIEDSLENSYVALMCRGSAIWLGGADQQQEGQWEWINGSSFEHTKWGADQPDNGGGNQNYLSMGQSAEWADEAGHVELAYVCEWDHEPGTEPIVDEAPVAVDHAPPVDEPAPAAAPPPPRIVRAAVPPESDLSDEVAALEAYLERQSLGQPQQRAAVVRRILDLASDPEKAAAERYVMLREMKRIAVKDHDVDLAAESMDMLARQFQVDTLAEKQEFLKTEFKESETVDQAGKVYAQLVRLAHQALARDACNVAHNTLQYAYYSARRSPQDAFRPKLAILQREVKPRYEEWQEFASQEEALEQNTNDANLNETVGRRYCFLRRNWEEGLPLLANGADPYLRALAIDELGEPKSPEGRVKLADEWWRVANSQEGGAARANVYQHAGDWYARARPDVTLGETAEHIDQRLKEVDALASATTVPANEVTETPVADARNPQINFEQLGWFGGRTGEPRQMLLRARGGSLKTEQAVANALEWLSNHQMSDGGWSFDHISASGGVGSHGGSMPQARNGATGLVLLAFFGSGETHAEGKYKKQIEKGLYFLCNRTGRGKDNAGSLLEEGGTMYSHALGTQALCEAYALTKDRVLRAPMLATLGFIAKSQNLERGGWRYKPKERGDVSVTGWQVTAIRLGFEAGAPVQPLGMRLELTQQFLKDMSYDGGAKFLYDKPSTGTVATTAIGLLCRMYFGAEHRDPSLRSGVDYVSRVGPKTDNVYFNYFATQVLQHHGGESWDEWNEALQELLLPAQATEGVAAGSWHFPGKDSAAGGRLYCTAMCALILQSYYRYVPVYEETRREILHKLSQISTDEREETVPRRE